MSKIFERIFLKRIQVEEDINGKIPTHKLAFVKITQQHNNATGLLMRYSKA
jgi:hypothetical protein